MLSAEAYSFQRKSRLAISLSWIAGYTNVVTFTVTGHVVSHVTGNSSMVANAVGGGQWTDAIFFGFLIAMFFAGAVASAIMTETADRYGVRSKYLLPIAVEAILLTCFALGIHQTRALPGSLHFDYLLCGLATAAMGLQNATITKISGATVRTTHLTGVVTDIGLEGVKFLLWGADKLVSRRPSRLSRLVRISRRHPSFLRLLLLGSIFCSFIFGALIGTLLFNWLPTFAMAFPIGFLLWIIISNWFRPSSRTLIHVTSSGASASPAHPSSARKRN